LDVATQDVQQCLVSLSSHIDNPHILTFQRTIDHPRDIPNTENPTRNQPALHFR
jgi:hypothetical protein